MLALIKKIDKFLDFHAVALVIVVFILILRIPNLSEPYWYGDEAIYLTLGQALNKGQHLYSQIIDHKTPIIYYLARVGTQFNFRMLNIIWMSVATLCFYALSFSLLKKRTLATTTTSIFALLTTLPWFEGNIPNGELFVLGFVLVGAVMLMGTSYYQHFFNPLETANRAPTFTKKDSILVAAAGLFFGLGILTKVPALFDTLAFVAIGYFTFTNSLLHTFFREKKLLGTRTKFLVIALFKSVGLLLLSVTATIGLSIAYFALNGDLQDYLQYGLLYNFHYVGTWQLSFQNQIVSFLFTLPGKALFVGAIGMILTFAWRKFRPASQFVLLWFFFTLFASLLSNRPYPHYFLQVVPPLALMVGLFIQSVTALVGNKTRRNAPKNVSSEIVSAPSYPTLIISLIGFGTLAATLLLLAVRPYPTVSYYQRWLSMVQNKISTDEYRRSFNPMTVDNYKLAKILRATGQDWLFIWGTNPMLYALSNTTPASRFTVSFHIIDLKAYDQTMVELRQQNPSYIVVMNDEKTPYPEFFAYLNANYTKSTETFEHFVLWKRIKSTTQKASE